MSELLKRERAEGAKHMGVGNTRWIGVSQAAHMLGCSNATVHRMIESGALEAYQLRGSRGWWKVSYASVVKHIERVKAEFGIEASGSEPNRVSAAK